MKNIDIIDIFQHLLSGIENEIVEFKEAKNDFDSSKLGKYFSAISNEANLKQKEYGWLIFGVEDKKHQIVGTQLVGKRQNKFLLLKFMNLNRKVKEC